MGREAGKQYPNLDLFKRANSPLAQAILATMTSGQLVQSAMDGRLEQILNA
jgi:molybdopterin biosynthesis enzyme